MPTRSSGSTSYFSFVLLTLWWTSSIFLVFLVTLPRLITYPGSTMQVLFFLLGLTLIATGVATESARIVHLVVHFLALSVATMLTVKEMRMEGGKSSTRGVPDINAA